MKRYQVFISSTFNDLTNEREAVLKSILKLNYFPAGMELFPSASVEQFEHIKKVIDDSDYYILIIGARYGDDSEGISYTEKEFDYALSKGIPILAFLHENPENIPFKFCEPNENKRRKLENFKNKVMKGRLISFWNNPDELSSKVILSLEEAIRTIPRQGWERALPISNKEILSTNQLLKKENIVYKERIKLLETEIEFLYKKQIEDFSNSINIKGTYVYNSIERKSYNQNIPIKKIFSLWYSNILNIQLDIQAKQFLEKAIENNFNINSFTIDEQSYISIKNSLSSTGVIAEFTIKKSFGIAKHIVVTDYGKKVWNTLN